MDEKINDGGPAFPIPIGSADPIGPVKWNDTNAGMSLRDWFAGMAMQGMYANDADNYIFEAVADAAYRTADAMIVAREAKP